MPMDQAQRRNRRCGRQIDPKCLGCAMASTLRKSPHTLSVGSALRSISVTDSTGACQCDGGGRSRRTAADDQRSGHRRATQSRNGRCHDSVMSFSIRPAVRTSRRQSAGTKLRAMEMRPSLRTKRCQRAAHAMGPNAWYGSQCRCRSPMNQPSRACASIQRMNCTTCASVR